MALGNRIENGIIATVTFVITTLVITLLIHFVSIRPMQKQFERQFDKQTAVIVELGSLAKYQIQNNFEKMRTKGNGQIILDLDNTLNALELETIPRDTTIINQNKKQSLWKRIFGNGK